MSSEELKNLYNSQFWQGDEPQDVVCTLTIGVGEQQVSIAGIALHPAHTVDSIFKSIYQHLLDNPPQELPAAHVPAIIPAQAGIIDIDHVQYREKTYLVEHIEEDTFVVKNDKGETINANSPTARAVVKAYKENL